MATREAQNEYQRQWIARRRADYFTGKSCSKCGSTENLELDHIDPEGKVDHRIWSWSAVRRDEELAKCQVLCQACHEAKTAEENRCRNGGLEHGGPKMYKLGCRCAPCKTNWNAKKAANRARRKELGLPHQ